MRQNIQAESGGAKRLLGYMRVSTDGQSMDLQRDALRAAGVAPEAVWSDVSSGARSRRPGLDAMLESAGPGDTIVIWRLDRLGRSLLHLATLAADLSARGVALMSLTDGVDTATATGRLLLGVLGTLAEFERETIRERVTSGLAAARVRGRVGGRPRAIGPDRDAAARRMLAAGDSIRLTARTLRVSEATLRRHLSASKGGFVT